MKLVTTTSVYPIGSDPFFTLRSLCAHGFEAADMALDYYSADPANRFRESDWLDRILRLRALSDELALPITHAHAPHSLRCMDDPLKAQDIRRSVQAAARLGARFIVVHPCHTDEENRPLTDVGDFINVNRRFTEMLLEEAVRNDVVLLSENLLWNATVDPAHIAQLVKEIGSPYFGWCWDTGHAHLMGIAPERIRDCVVPPVSLHLQDNQRRGDEHLIPTDGTVNWAEVFSVLKEVGYAGDFVLEAHHQSCEAGTQTERDAVLDRLYTVSSQLRERYFGASSGSL